MRRLAVIVIVGLAFCLAALTTHAQPAKLAGDWVGGFWFNKHWVRLNVRFDAEQSNIKGTANVIFSSYEGANGASLGAIKFEVSRLNFEVPVNSAVIKFNGQLRNDTIAGTYEYAGAGGRFGLTRVAAANSQTLARVYGLYRFSPNRIIAVGQDFDGPNSLRYADFDTGRSGALWPSSENFFFSGEGFRVTFPIKLRVEVVSNRSGKVTRLVWKPVIGPKQIASRIPLDEERVSWRNGDITLGGTLITPNTAGPHPVIIIVPGDFGSSRDFLRLYAYNFLRRGVAALIFDSRGAGGSTGPVNSTPFSDLANDVLAGVQLLKSKEKINPRQIGLFGFSNSAWTTALAASRSEDVAFLINQSMSGVPPWRQEIFRAGEMLRAEGFSEEIVKQGVRFMELKFDAARTGEGWEQLQAIQAKSGNERWFPFTNPSRSLERLRQVYATSMTYDPVPSLEGIKCPVLAVWGGKDRYVPVKASVAIFERAMTKAGNRDYTVRILPTGSHSIFDAKTGSTTESSELKGWAPAYLNLISEWLVKRVDIKK